MSYTPDERVLELLAGRAVDGLDEAERAELERLLAEHPGADDGSMDRAAAAAMVAMVGVGEPLPGALRGRLVATLREEAASDSRRIGGGGRGGARLAAWSGWVAAAACLLIAAAVMSRRAGPSAIDPERARAEFLQTASDVRTAAWGDWDDPEQKGVLGEVAWSESSQRGYMTFRGLAANDPGEEQYQLWIIDERGLEQRISGGVFDADADGEVVVEIEPAVEIHGAAAFAVTVERPGGVWVSDMSRRVVIAALPGGGG